MICYDPIKVIIANVSFTVIFGEKRTLPSEDYYGDPFIYLAC